MNRKAEEILCSEHASSSTLRFIYKQKSSYWVREAAGAMKNQSLLTKKYERPS